MHLNPPTINFEDLQWKNAGPNEDDSRMLTRINIGPQAMHLEAWQVEADKEGIDRGVAFPDDFELIYRGLMTEGVWETLEINGKRYVLFAHPYGD